MRPAGIETGARVLLIPGVLLAAGTSSRFGRPKLLQEWQGQPLLRHSAASLLEAGLSPLVAVIPPNAAFRTALSGLSVTLIENPQPERGIGRSISLAMRAMPEDAAAVLIAVADQPLLSAGAVRQLLDAFRPGAIVSPRYGGHSGNPRLFDRRFFPDLSALDGDRGGQLIADQHQEAVIDVSLDEALGIDVDSPSDWDRVRRFDRSESER